METFFNLPEDLATIKQTAPYAFPQQPFEKIGFALSGGGFRAASYGLGVLSMMHAIQLNEEKEYTLLQKIRFVSSASGGTITLAVYLAAIHQNIPFSQFYHHLKDSMKGEALVHHALEILQDESQWEQGGKSRNIINAFAKAYDATLFALVPEPARKLGAIMQDASSSLASPPHIEEFCFNATEFFTGVWFRFQGGKSWTHQSGGKLGNHNIGINWAHKEAVATLKTIKLADVLAASSCFPLGFEPIVFPNDFTYRDGPSIAALKDSVWLRTHTWDEKKTAEENRRSPRAKEEKDFSDAKVFGLMDGGICDNQGLFSLLTANARNKDNKEDQETYNRFDLMMVSDVTSFFMEPYRVPQINTEKAWMRTSLAAYWQRGLKLNKKIKNGVRAGWWISLVLALLFLSPLFLEGITIAGVALAVVGLLLFLGTSYLKKFYNNTFRGRNVLSKMLAQPSLKDLVLMFLPKENFTRRTVLKVAHYLQGVPTGVVLQMVNARLQSAVTMISDIFLKHIRRLIYELLFQNKQFIYRRMSNLVYDLTFTNDDNRRKPSFEPKEEEPAESYGARKHAFLQEWSECCVLTAAMQHTAETAYNTGTTLWFEPAQETPAEKGKENNREALIATGQFTTCYNLLGYALGLKHSRHYATLDLRYQARLDGIISQLKAHMKGFADDPYYLYKSMEQKHPSR